ncbi:P-loop containing nucleoside triphosphate hydrolase protein [Lipomyces tetrasporus]
MLARGQLHCIGATTVEEYRKYIEKDAAFERRLQKVDVREPTVRETVAILRGLQGKYELHHGVRILDNALVTAAQLAGRYLTYRRLPDSAVDLIDEAAASVAVARDSRPEQLDTLERQFQLVQVKSARWSVMLPMRPSPTSLQLTVSLLHRRELRPLRRNSGPCVRGSSRNAKASRSSTTSERGLRSWSTKHRKLNDAATMNLQQIFDISLFPTSRSALKRLRRTSRPPRRLCSKILSPQKLLLRQSPG